MRPPAQVDESVVAVDRDLVRTRAFSLVDATDDLRLERLIREHLEGVIDRERLPNEGLVDLDDLLHTGLDPLEVLRGEGSADIEVVVEAIGDRRPDRVPRSRVEIENRLSHHMRSRVTQDESAFLRVLRHHGQGAVVIDRTVQIKCFAVERHGYCSASKAGTDRSRNVETGSAVVVGTNGTVGEGKLDRHGEDSLVSGPPRLQTSQSDATRARMGTGEEGGIMDALALAERIAAGNRLQDLTRPTKSLAKNYHYRIWRDGSSVLLKVYGTQARERRESHAIEALTDVDGMPVRIDGDSQSEPAWALFEDPGEWSLGSLPGNADAARRAGEILRSIHQSDPKALTNLRRGIDAEWIEVDFPSTMRRLARYRGRVGIDAELYEAIAAVPPPKASEPVASHTNPTPEHFHVDRDGAVTLVDWEWATLAPPEWDLTKAAWLLRIRAGSSAANALQDGYGRSLDRFEMNRWIIYHAAMLLVYEAEQRMFDAGADSYSDTISEILRALDDV